MLKRILLVYIFLSFITIPIGGLDSTNPVLSRLTVSDAFGFLALIIGFKKLLLGFVNAKNISRVYSTGFIMVVFFLLFLGFALNPNTTIVESGIILFLLLISVQISYVFRNNFFDLLIPTIINCAIAAIFIGFYDVFASVIGLPRLFRARASGEVISAFRNAGQAGAYFLVILTILLPLQFSKLNIQLSKKYQKRLKIAIVLSIMFLLSTGKIAAYIGFFIGWMLFLLQKRDFKSVFITTFIGVIMAVVFFNLETIAPDFYDRIVYKFDSRIGERYRGTKGSSFLEKNWGGAIKAFIDNPISGTGLGGVNKFYSDHEVHSTYMKMIGETGLIGVIGYVFFIVSFINLYRKRIFRNNPFSEYIKTSFPFIIGCLVSWGYTYHLRKREYWILIAIIFIVNAMAISFEREKNNKELDFRKKLS